MNVVIPDDFTTKKKPFHFNVEIYLNGYLVGFKALGYYHIRQISNGDYVISGPDSRFAFTKNNIVLLTDTQVSIKYEVTYA